RGRGPSGEIHPKRAILSTAHSENAASSGEPDWARDAVLEKTVRGCEGGMSTEINLHTASCEPPKQEVGLGLRVPDDEAGVREIRLTSHGGHPVVRVGGFQLDNRRGFARKRSVGEGATPP